MAQRQVRHMSTEAFQALDDTYQATGLRVTDGEIGSAG